MERKKSAVVLLSGGIDSSTCVAIAASEGYDLYALSIRYGQRHHFELQAAERIGKAFWVTDHKVIDLNLTTFGGSSLTTAESIPENRDIESIGTGIPSTYVPARNTIFLSLALAYAETVHANHIFIGANAIDYSGYPDCRPEFLQAFENVANLGTKRGIEGDTFTIQAPLLRLKKSEIILTGIELGVDYGLTHSCYNPDERGYACGSCDSCQLRLMGFAEAGLTDPVTYQK
ncbi:7-cyano-7-deazaguanine synthase QueC [bacterium]|nr:7-cyano-7-deazaguanine synthase QueC [bacterium]